MTINKNCEIYHRYNDANTCLECGGLKKNLESKNTETANDKGVSSSELLATDFRPLYETVNEMMAELGAEGTINTRSVEVHEVMNALYDLDKGEYNAEKVFGS